MRPPPRDRARRGGGVGNLFRRIPVGPSRRRVGIATLNDVNNPNRVNNNNNSNNNRRQRPVRYDVRRILRAHGSDIEVSNLYARIIK